MEVSGWRKESDRYTMDVLTPEGEQGYLDAYFPPLSGKPSTYTLSLGVCEDKASCDVASITFVSGRGTETWGDLETLRNYSDSLQGLPEDVREIFMGMLEGVPVRY